MLFTNPDRGRDGAPQRFRSRTESERARATLLTIGALYFVPISIGLKVETFSSMYFLMLGLAAVAVSKVIHLREAVTDTDTYPPQLVLVDLILILTFLIMFQLLARPYSLGPGAPTTWTVADLTHQDTSERAFLRGAELFWSLIFVLFVFLIPLWTWVSWRYQGLRRHHLWRYFLGWGIGAYLGWHMRQVASHGSSAELLRDYRWCGPASMVSLIFLGLEVLEGSKFKRRVLRAPASSTPLEGRIWTNPVDLTIARDHVPDQVASGMGAFSAANSK